ncbi:MAG: hypothetical protein GVY07_04775 [Bacteroidetes bacterium]|jgi:hypothetical protein|nr:hypothetical protein [Bacteroidota bacterium]
MRTFFISIINILLVLFAISCSDDSVSGSEDSELVVSITTDPATLIETEEQQGTVTIELNRELPDEGLLIPINVRASDGSAKPLARFKIAQFNPADDVEGADLVDGSINPTTLDGFSLSMNNQTSKVYFTVNDDDFDDGPIDVTFSLQETDTYQIDEEEFSASFTIIEEEE